MKRWSVGQTVLVLMVVCWSAGSLYGQHRVAADGRAGTGVESVQAMLERPVTIQLANATLKEAVNAVAASANVEVQYRADMLDAVATRVNVRLVGVPLQQAFARVLARTSFVAVPTADGLVTIKALFPDDLQQQVREQGVMVGIVRSARTQVPIAGARIFVGTATQPVVTDADERFRISVAAGETQISVRAVGYTRQARQVVVTNGQTVTVDFVLESSASVLDEVIVTGTVVATERREIATPITVITAGDIEQRGITRIDQLFRGEVPGVYARERGISTYESGLGARVESEVYVRGPASLDGAANPLKVYVDGIEILEAGYLGTIDPGLIERIEIITGPQAASIYGSGAMGGVMQIFTKRGAGLAKPRVSLRARFGWLENNFSNGLTPTHDHLASVEGGVQSLLTYSANVTYKYTGQWQPGLFDRSIGTSVGIAIGQKSYNLNASANTSYGSNGVGTSLLFGNKLAAGETRPAIPWAGGVTGQRSGYSSQIVGLNADHRIAQGISQHATVGLTFTNLSMAAQAPGYFRVDDSLWSGRQRSGSRSSLGYRVNFANLSSRLFSSNLVLGIDYSNGVRTEVQTSGTTSTQTSFASARVTVPYDETHYGYFGQWRIGLFNAMYWTLGVRAERSPTFGSSHKIDWVPANGVAFNFDVNAMTVKLQASNGRQTKLPNPALKEDILVNPCGIPCEPALVLSQLGNPDLRPERSRGPQGGIELYFGSRGSLSVNVYDQKVTDLITSNVIDSAAFFRVPFGDTARRAIYQGENSATIRQNGIESRGSFLLGPFTFGATHSWNDATVLFVHPNSNYSSYVKRGSKFNRAITHFGSVSLGFARGQTSISLVSNWVGAWPADGGWGNDYFGWLIFQDGYARLRMYSDVALVRATGRTLPGFWRSDLSGTRALSDKVSLSVNLRNLQNSYTSETRYDSPILGRTTTIGVSLRR